MVGVQLYRFTADILYQAPSARRRDVGPLRELAVPHRFTSMYHGSLAIVTRRFLRIFLRHDSHRRLSDERGVFGLHRVGDLLVGLGFLFLVPLHLCHLPRNVVGPLKRLPLPSGKAPDDERRDNDDQEISWSPEALAVGEPVG